MKKLIILFALILTNVSLAIDYNPLDNLREQLESYIVPSIGGKQIHDLKAISEYRNVEISVAFENYLIAKKRVSIARSAFNPLTTGHILGVGLGLSYLWAPIAIEAVTSIPTKIYDVTSNKFLAKAALYNSYDAKMAINNELAHLYYDFLVHDAILKTIDKEIEILMFQQDILEKTAAKTRKATIDYNHSQVLSLKMERVDIYNLLKEETAALKTLLAMNPESSLEFSHVNMMLKSSFLDGIERDKIKGFALINSNKLKSKINLLHAAESNVKSVKWSIVSFSGLNFSWRSKVEIAENDERIAALNRDAVEKNVATDALIQFQKLNSAINVGEYYADTASSSMQLFEDNYSLFLQNQKPIDYAIESSVGAIRDFRNKVIAHYNTWSSLEDFSHSLTFSLKYENEDDRVQSQIERSQVYNISSLDFRVIQDTNYSNDLVYLISNKLGAVEKVQYNFENGVYGSFLSTANKNNFRVSISKNGGLSKRLSGVATVVLKNGYEIKVRF